MKMNEIDNVVEQIIIIINSYLHIFEMSKKKRIRNLRRNWTNSVECLPYDNEMCIIGAHNICI